MMHGFDDDKRCSVVDLGIHGFLFVVKTGQTPSNWIINSFVFSLNPKHAHLYSVNIVACTPKTWSIRLKFFRVCMIEPFLP